MIEARLTDQVALGNKTPERI